MGFRAQYTGICPECEQAIRPGQVITMEDGRARHVLCPEGEDGLYIGKPEVICPECFLTSCDGHE